MIEVEQRGFRGRACLTKLIVVNFVVLVVNFVVLVVNFVVLLLILLFCC